MFTFVFSIQILDKILNLGAVCLINYQVSVNNEILFIEKAGIKSDYGTRIKNNFQAEPFQYNFQGDANKAVNIVNNKVARASNGGLKKFLDQSKSNSNM